MFSELLTKHAYGWIFAFSGSANCEQILKTQIATSSTVHILRRKYTYCVMSTGRGPKNDFCSHRCYGFCTSFRRGNEYSNCVLSMHAYALKSSRIVSNRLARGSHVRSFRCISYPICVKISLFVHTQFAIGAFRMCPVNTLMDQNECCEP